MLGWDGPWPPPKKLVMVIGAKSGAVAICDPTERDNAELIEKMRDIDAEITEYYRISHSVLPDEARDHPNIFRGAVYVIIEDA